jgi:TRAP-type C4-dicarboxylate transport system permease large subunit
MYISTTSLLFGILIMLTITQGIFTGFEYGIYVLPTLVINYFILKKMVFLHEKQNSNK